MFGKKETGQIICLLEKCLFLMIASRDEKISIKNISKLLNVFGEQDIKLMESVIKKLNQELGGDEE